MEEYPKGTDKQLWPGQVKDLIARDQPGDPDVIKALICWLMDGNWPGSMEASDYLITLEDKVKPYIISILNGSDEMWKYYTINRLVSFWPKVLLLEILPTLICLAKNNDKEEINLSALQVICENQLLSLDELNNLIDNLVKHNPHLEKEDIDHLRETLKQED